jgi:SAM-dependent methyltransferase
MFEADSAYYRNLRAPLLDLVPNEAVDAVLDIGCGSGVYLAWCKGRGARRLVGVELREDLAKATANMEGVEAVHGGDISQIDLSNYTRQFDLILAGFVLEHVPDPWAVLKKLKTLLKPQGVIVGSLPNVQHHSVVLPLLFRGRWRYETQGIMDWTHLRFFSKRTIIDALNQCGYVLEDIRPEYPGGRRYKLATYLSAGLLEGVLAYAYNFRAAVGVAC